jgi:hypothetical protein
VIRRLLVTFLIVLGLVIGVGSEFASSSTGTPALQERSKPTPSQLVTPIVPYIDPAARQSACGSMRPTIICQIKT